MADIHTLVRAHRPQPTIDEHHFDQFAPDQDGLGEWAREMFIDEDGPLFNQRHMHLAEAAIGWLWTSAENANRDKLVAGECRLIGPAQRKWTSGMARFQLAQWFGYVPDFLITISADYARVCDDWAFCALIEHELCHAAQDVDVFGMPRFNKEGQPMFRLVGHDVEQFVDVVARYGAGAADVEELVRVANKGPSIGEAQMRLACGTCRRVAA
tara:strand:+ start:1336 stop:1971 length:636 start_codon:yes stop_codon:yes gene_type:complete